MPEVEAAEDAVEVFPVVVVSQTFPARPSSIPDIRDFVRRCLEDSPLTDEGTREVTETVNQALLDAAGPTGTIQVSFRIFPEHVEVDVLNSEPSPAGMSWLEAHTGGRGAPPYPASSRPRLPAAGPLVPAESPAESPGSFAEWMSAALRREGLTQEAAAHQLGVSVKTVSRWVGGETEPRLRDLRRIQERFGELPLG
jgi:hypothetical protein